MSQSTITFLILAVTVRAIVFPDMHATQMACAEPEGLVDQEAAYLAALPNPDGATVASYTRPTRP